MKSPRKKTGGIGPKPIQFRSILDAIDGHMKAADGLRIAHEARDESRAPERLMSSGVVQFLMHHSMSRVFQLIDGGHFSEAGLVGKARELESELAIVLDRLAVALGDELSVFDRDLEAFAESSTDAGGKVLAMLAKRSEQPVHELVCMVALIHLLDRVMCKRLASMGMPRRRHPTFPK